VDALSDESARKLLSDNETIAKLCKGRK
jgi:hypothetical protein